MKYFQINLVHPVYALYYYLHHTVHPHTRQNTQTRSTSCRIAYTASSSCTQNG